MARLGILLFLLFSIIHNPIAAYPIPALTESGNPKALLWFSDAS